MKNLLILLLYAIADSACIGSNSMQSSTVNFPGAERAFDSTLIATKPLAPDRFVYGDSDEVRFKVHIGLLKNELKKIIAEVDNFKYKEHYQSMLLSISEGMTEKDSLDLNSIQLTGQIIYPLHCLAKSGQIFIEDMSTGTSVDSIWMKTYREEKELSDLRRVRFVEGVVYATKSGIEFLKVPLKSGH